METSSPATANIPCGPGCCSPSLHLPDEAGGSWDFIHVIPLVPSAGSCTGCHLVHVAQSGRKVVILAFRSGAYHSPPGIWMGSGVTGPIGSSGGTLFKLCSSPRRQVASIPVSRKSHSWSRNFHARSLTTVRLPSCEEPHTSPMGRLHGERHSPRSSNQPSPAQPSPGARQIEEEAVGDLTAAPMSAAVCVGP